MSNTNTNKYRITYPKPYRPPRTRALSKPDVIEEVAMIRASAPGANIGQRLLFDGKRVSPEHRDAIIKAADLRNQIMKMEGLLKNSRPHREKT